MESVSGVTSLLESQVELCNEKLQTLIVVDRVYNAFHAKNAKCHSKQCQDYRDELIIEVDEKLQDIVDILQGRPKIEYHTLEEDRFIRDTLRDIPVVTHCLCKERENGVSSACHAALRLELKCYLKYYDPSSIGNSECSIDLS